MRGQQRDCSLLTEEHVRGRKDCYFFKQSVGYRWQSAVQIGGVKYAKDDWGET